MCVCPPGKPHVCLTVASDLKMCMSVCERETERERVHVCYRKTVGERESDVCVCEREREK